MLQVKYGSEASSMLRYHKHTRIETSTTRRGFNCTLNQKLINFLLNSRMMSCCCCDIKLPEVMEQGRTGPKLKMVTLNHINHKPGPVFVYCVLGTIRKSYAYTVRKSYAYTVRNRSYYISSNMT